MSKDYENRIVKEIHRDTGDAVRTYRCGYSGNNAIPQPDFLVTDARTAMNHGVESKGPIQSERCYIEAGDIEQLIACQNGATAVFLVVKFSHREPVVVRYFADLTEQQHPDAEAYNDMTPPEQFAVLFPSAFNPRVTESNTLALDKPSTDDWPSAQAGSADVDAILSGMGIETDKSIAVK